MKISFDPKNLDGAERYMGKSDRTAETSSQRKWLIQATTKMFADRGQQVPEFAILDRGVGFFWEVIGSTSAPVFSTEVADEELPDLIAVTYWVAADAIE